ncbi:ABC transporter ATP-binding protein [Phenylobacterium sp.]|uniref:ABC transporter ATP-binding protein n=1 Tax=Phenylobacterium sp. TaxID=1871053 RepID=UPI00301D4405
MLAAERLHKRYGSHTALHSFDLTVRPGEVYALLGPNGAGKTTTINCFLGFVRPDGGRVLVDGCDPAQDPLGARAALAYIPEQVNLYGWFSGLENLAYFAELGGHSYGADELVGFLREAGLEADALSRPVSGYSKGMRQKVGIAIALAKDAKGLLLDEPTSGLDPRASHEFSELLRKLSSRGVSILMATHDIFRALDVAHRIGIMVSGRLLEEMDAKSVTGAELENRYLEATRATAISASS